MRDEAAPRWRTLGQQKEVELSALIRDAQLMKQTLQIALQCGCADLRECARTAECRIGRAEVTSKSVWASSAPVPSNAQTPQASASL
jgi:hypothetical protein